MQVPFCAPRVDIQATKTFGIKEVKERRRSSVGIQNAPWYSRLRRRCCIRLNRRHALLLCPGQSSQHHPCVRAMCCFQRSKGKCFHMTATKRVFYHRQNHLVTHQEKLFSTRMHKLIVRSLASNEKKRWKPHNQSDGIETLHLPLR